MADEKRDPVRVADAAVHNFVEDSYNCAEAVVAAFSAARGEPPRTLTPLVTGFGGGIGSLGHVCGAITGALVVLGREAAEAGAARPAVRAAAAELYASFERRFGTTSCHALTQHDCNAAGGAPYDVRHCAKYLRHAVETTARLVDAAAAQRAA